MIRGLLFAPAAAAAALTVVISLACSGPARTTNAPTPPVPEAPRAPSAPAVPTSDEQEASVDSARGRELFAANCASCHLESGKGDPHHKKDDIPDFTSASWQAHENDAAIAATVRKGKGKVMPAFPNLTEEEVAAIVAHVRTFAPAR